MALTSLKYHKRETSDYRKVRVHSMESLESRLDRLSPEQRKEVEDFVEFLLSRSGQVFSPLNTPVNNPPVLNVTPPPFSLIEPVPSWMSPNRPDYRTLPVPEPGQVQRTSQYPPRSMRSTEVSRKLSPLITWIMGSLNNILHSATEAVKKVKRKIIAREEQEKPRHLFDWVD